jgi:hypothetical protein
LLQREAPLINSLPANERRYAAELWVSDYAAKAAYPTYETALPLQAHRPQGITPTPRRHFMGRWPLILLGCAFAHVVKRRWRFLPGRGMVAAPRRLTKPARKGGACRAPGQKNDAGDVFGSQRVEIACEKKPKKV